MRNIFDQIAIKIKNEIMAQEDANIFNILNRLGRSYYYMCC
jgi:hypothetical protein